MKKKFSNPYLIATVGAILAFIIAYIDSTTIDSNAFRDFHWWGQIGYAIVILFMAGVCGMILYMIYLMLMRVYCWKFGHKWALRYKGNKISTERCLRCKKVRKVT